VSGLSSPVAWATAVGYLVVVAGVGAWASRRARDPKGFFIANQSLGLVVTGLATATAAFSGFVFLGGPGLTYRIGAASLLICLPLSFTAALLGWVVALPLRRLAGAHEIYTVADVVALRFGRRTGGWAALTVVVGTVGYLGTQLLALGIFLEAIFGTRDALGPWSRPVAMGIGLVVLLAYSAAGGMVAGVYTDVLQGVLMVAAALAVGWVAVESVGGFGPLVESIAASESLGPSFLDPLGGRVSPVGALGFFFVFSVGVLGQPHMLHKLFMIESPRRLKWFPLVVAGSQSLCLFIWLGVGFAVPALVASGAMSPLVSPDDATPSFLLHAASPLLIGLVVAGVLAAIMSTADSFLNIGAAALVRDLPRAFDRPVADELEAGRWAVVGLGIASAVVALTFGDLVALLGTLAFGTFAAALTPALAIGLAWRRVGPIAAGASIAIGLGLNVGLEVGRRFEWIVLPAGALPSALALAASFVVLIVTTFVAPGPPASQAVWDVIDR